MHTIHNSQNVPTEVVSVNSKQPEATIIERAARLLQQGQLVVFPTETVYGLGADAFQTRAIEQIFSAKGRPLSDPLIVHIAEEAELETLVIEISPVARLLAKAFWPGPLTLIMPAGERVPHLITAGLPTVAIRMPGNTIAHALIRAAGTPIAAPSANRFMHVSPTTAEHVLADLGGRVPLILDGGPSEVGVESTVLDLCAPRPIILRPGGISLEALRAILPDVQPPRQNTSEVSEHDALTSPGQMLIHYAPTVPTFLYEGPIDAVYTAMLADIQQRKERGETTGILIGDADQPVFQASGALMYTLGTSPEQIARHLFAGLRTLEESGVQSILCRSFEIQGLGLAIRDRLRKAAGGKIITCTAKR